MYDLCKAAGIDYDPVAIGVGMDSRIGDSHIQVTEMRGYGGHCFPKDMEAIAALAKEYKNADLGLINQSINYNNNIRKDTDRK
jgi:UDPglucose 6-dehydrogenase